MARTAVIAGTATAVSNNVSRRQARRWQEREYQQMESAPYAAAPPPPPPPPAASAGADTLTAELERLGSLRSSGVITDEEFAAAKAKLLGL